MDFALAQAIVDLLSTSDVPMSAIQITKALKLERTYKSRVNSTLYHLKTQRMPIGDLPLYVTSQGATPPMWYLTSLADDN